MNYRIDIDLSTDDVMDSISSYEESNFVYDCYSYMSVYKKKNFLEKIGNFEVVEILGEDSIIEELQRRGYKVTNDEEDD